MRVCRVEREHHCSDAVKHRKSNEGSHETCPYPSDGSLIGFEKWACNGQPAAIGGQVAHEGRGAAGRVAGTSVTTVWFLRMGATYGARSQAPLPNPPAHAVPCDWVQTRQ